MPGPHYAISEALIVITAVWVATRFARKGAWFGALGAAIFGLAAAIGAFRFGAGQVDELASIHRGFSQIGGATAMALMAVDSIAAPKRDWPFAKQSIAWTACLATLCLSISMQKLAVPMFAGWSLIAICTVSLWPAQHLGRRVWRGALVAVFLVNALFVRQSPVLDPSASWHVFHTLIALWLIAVWWIWDDASRAS